MVVERNDRTIDGKLDRGLKITRNVKRYNPEALDEVDAPEVFIVYQSDLDAEQKVIDDRRAELDKEQAKLDTKKARLTALYQAA